MPILTIHTYLVGAVITKANKKYLFGKKKDFALSNFKKKKEFVGSKTYVTCT